jgi:RNA polymerase sigma-70 factor (ECF subfamily)
LANRLLGWPGDVDDITQDIFLAAYLGIKKFHGRSSLRTWLFTITINKCRNYNYRQMLRLRMFSRMQKKVDTGSTVGAAEKVINTETAGQIRKAVRALPAKYREAIVLKYLQQLPTAEISRVLGISENTVSVRLNRARARLKQELAELIGQEP